MLIRSIELNNFLSFGSDPDPLALSSLNLLIGPNGSGKSNLLEAIELIRSAPVQWLKTIREGGGVDDWLWKGADGVPAASVAVVVDSDNTGTNNLRYGFSFTSVGQRFELVDERIEKERPVQVTQTEPQIFYLFNNARPIINVRNEQRRLRREDLDPDRSILAQRRDPDQYPEITRLADQFGSIRIYREWCFGRQTIPRLPQKADLPNDFLESDASNLALVLNQLRRHPEVKMSLLNSLRKLYDGIDDYDVRIEGGTVQVFFLEGLEGQKGRFTVPATRLSDGTLRYLCLLAILCHPKPPPLICIEEPELGLHPDVLPVIADLLKQASQRCQLIVTTHSDILVDAMTDQPESVLVCEKSGSGTGLTRLNSNSLKPWLEKYRLGELWTRGELGGMRW